MTQLLATSTRTEAQRVKGRVLVVDDDPVLLKLHEQVLAKVGFEVVASPNALQAIDPLARLWR